MASTRDIRRRIKSVKNTRQITKAMELVAASKMKKAQQAALAGRPYAELMAYCKSRSDPMRRVVSAQANTRPRTPQELPQTQLSQQQQQHVYGPPPRKANEELAKPVSGSIDGLMKDSQTDR